MDDTDLQKIYLTEVFNQEQIVTELLHNKIAGGVAAGVDAFRANKKLAGQQGGANVFKSFNTGYMQTKYNRFLDNFKERLETSLGRLEHDISTMNYSGNSPEAAALFAKIEAMRKAVDNVGVAAPVPAPVVPPPAPVAPSQTTPTRKHSTNKKYTATVRRKIKRLATTPHHPRRRRNP